MYADDVALFLRLAANDITLTLDILQLFGEASGLNTNVQKSSVLPIVVDTIFGKKYQRRGKQPASTTN